MPAPSKKKGRRAAAARSHRPAREGTPPQPNDVDGDQSPPLTLEAFLVAAQKSLARSVRSAQQSAKAENEFALGERPVYMIDGLEMEVRAALAVAPPERGGRQGERVLLDLDAPADRRSIIRFRVQTTAMELLHGAKLELANLDPLGEKRPLVCMRAWLVDDRGLPVQGHEIGLHFVRAGEKKAKDVIRATTDAAGRVDFFVLAEEDEVKVVGDRKRHKVYLRGGGTELAGNEYFVWATAEVKEEWSIVAEPSAPRPPYVIKRDKEGKARELCSEMHRLRVV